MERLIDQAIDLFVVLASIVVSLIALAFAVRYYHHTRQQRVGVAWLLMLLAVLGISLSEVTDAAAAFQGDSLASLADLFGLLAEIALAAGFVRLYGVELAAERVRQESLRQRVQQAESLSSATLELSASLQLNDVLRGLVQQALELSGADIAAVYRVAGNVEPMTTELVFARRGQSALETREHHPGAITHLLLRSGQPQFIEDVASDPFLRNESLGNLASIAGFPLLHDGHVVGILVVGFHTRRSFGGNDQRLLTTFAGHAALAMRNAELYETVERLSVTDSLTNLANRRRFDQELSAELIRARRYGKSLSLIIFDLDHFKAINDSSGHLVGDLALAVVAEVLRQCCRETDIAARVGGEEFGLILPETKSTEAMRVAERVRGQLANTPVAWEGQTLFVTLSAGVIGSTGKSLPTDSTSLFRLADQALYRAKQQGRNRVGRISVWWQRICNN